MPFPKLAQVCSQAISKGTCAFENKPQLLLALKRNNMIIAHKLYADKWKTSDVLY
jgi:hypothetical protein